MHEGSKEEQILNMIHLPKADLMKFDGDPLKYWIFIRSFDNSIGTTSISDSSKLTRLLQYCSGKALSVIECCAVMNPEYGYKEARRILQDRFGNQFVISRAWTQRITEGPILRYGDNAGLRQYADSVKSCIVTLSAMGRLEEVNNQDRIRKMTGKLPVGLQNRWRNQAVSHFRMKGYYPDINEFAQFMELVSDEANDPVFGHIHLESRDKPNREGYKRGTSFQTVMQSGNPKPACKLCSGDHAIYMCNSFRQMNQEARLKFMQDQKLCYNCFKPDHKSYECTKGSMCRIDRCNKRHSMLLHHALQSYRRMNGSTQADRGQQRSPQQPHFNREQHETQTFSTHHSARDVNGAGRVALPVVPVTVRKNNGDCLTTYAFLDSGSTNSFCSKELYDHLGLAGTKTSLSLTTLTSEERHSDTTCISLEVSDVEGRNQLRLPYVYVIPKVPVPERNKVGQKDVEKWPHMQGVSLPQVDEAKISILIGQDNPGAIAPLDVRRGKVDEPYAVLTAFGWTLNGPLENGRQGTVVSNFIRTDQQLTNCLERIWKLDSCGDQADDSQNLSRQDKQVLNLWKDTAEIIDGHYSMPIPFKTKDPKMPDNYYMAETRLESLGRNLHDHYTQGIKDLLEKGYAEKVSDSEFKTDKPVWYLPHHAVTSDKKPNKVRIVFDCSARCGGTSLNEEVLQGPDLTNKLIGVLQRFREGHVAVMGDIEAMFHQVRVKQEHCDVLRFLWWPGGNLSLKPEVYRMTVHLFGGIWSPSFAGYALKRTAEDNAADFDEVTVSTVSDNFYVDDCLKSTTSDEKAIHLVKATSDLLNRDGFNMTKWTSNSRKVVESIPTERRAKDLKNIDFGNRDLPQERALGVVWDTETDKFGFTVKPKHKPMTRRGLISIISSVYDPFGIACPVILKAKGLFQNECGLKKGWDDTLEPDNVRKFMDWLHDLPEIENLRIPRCLFPVDFGEVVKCELHHFSDASLNGYGAVSYFRAINSEGVSHCSFLMAKARRPPMKDITIPRLELSAAVVSVKLNETLLRELNLKIDSSTYWTDSMIVLHYIKSEKLRFQTFVGNRVSLIQESTSPSDWRYVNTELNPGDHASRGLDAQQITNCKQWPMGPEFLWKEEIYWPPVLDVFDVDPSKLEVRKTKVFFSDSEIGEKATDRLLNRYSSWTKLKRTVCWILRLKECLLEKIRGSKHKDSNITTKPLSVDELRNAELEIVKYVQKCHFPSEIRELKLGQPVKRSSFLYKLEPMINSEGILCIGGRLSNAPISEQAKHRMILSKDHHVDRLIACHTHEILGHSGTEHVLSHLRQRFWIIGARVMLKSMFRKCVYCRKMQGSKSVRQMAELPTDRVTPHRPPFTFIGVDCFGPFEVKRARSIVKRYMAVCSHA